MLGETGLYSCFGTSRQWAPQVSLNLLDIALSLHRTEVERNEEGIFSGGGGDITILTTTHGRGRATIHGLGEEALGAAAVNNLEVGRHDRDRQRLRPKHVTWRG